MDSREWSFLALVADFGTGSCTLALMPCEIRNARRLQICNCHTQERTRTGYQLRLGGITDDLSLHRQLDSRRSHSPVIGFGQSTEQLLLRVIEQEVRTNYRP